MRTTCGCSSSQQLACFLPGRLSEFRLLYLSFDNTTSTWRCKMNTSIPITLYNTIYKNDTMSSYLTSLLDGGSVQNYVQASIISRPNTWAMCAKDVTGAGIDDPVAPCREPAISNQGCVKGACVVHILTSLDSFPNTNKQCDDDHNKFSRRHHHRRRHHRHPHPHPPRRRRHHHPHPHPHHRRRHHRRRRRCRPRRRRQHHHRRRYVVDHMCTIVLL